MSDAEPDVDLDAELDELYVMAPAGFVVARDTLARRLRSTGRRDDSAAVKSLRRPTVAAWALNQLARRRADDVRRLVEQGDQLRRVQAELLAGGDRDRLRAATRARRTAVDSLADAALGLLGTEGRGGGEAHRAEVVATLEAASLEPDAGAALMRGRLTTGLEPPAGFGLMAPAPPGPSPPPSTPIVEDGSDEGQSEAARSARLAEAREVAADARALASQRRAESSAQRDRAARALRAATEAEEYVERLTRDLEAARRSAVDAAGEAERAAAAAADAERAAEAADAQARTADAAVARLEAG